MARDRCKDIKKQLTFPKSPAFVNERGARGEAEEMTETLDFCRKRNIPFNHEEHNYFRLKQAQAKFKSYKHSLNACFETNRPTEFETGVKLLKDSKDRPPSGKVSNAFADTRLYMPSTANKPYAKFKKNLENLITDTPDQKSKSAVTTRKAARVNTLTQKALTKRQA